jgi:hypothetical protein
MHKETKNYCPENIKGSRHVGDLVVDEKIISQKILEKYDIKFATRLNCLRTSYTAGCLRTR